jgi:hypothetical protein
MGVSEHVRPFLYLSLTGNNNEKILLYFNACRLAVVVS